ncbi:siphovirus ReqiPepy6 Gp37-like family protein [Cellulomonas sp. C5510]|uniref:siphovirus ReqiPepy6 Gp37-like family protein n=1 Tax=Cellulomonas sp. C5510 TaxID=2871170 RepID=UPI001C93CDDF|nr:siphovirus ReqiPepy6 Gp37-like family protein [Cellulomonas sp. C5510]QZN86606.1 siphovirus ReqiPepy6 Gp37-like family protein [Cellulomonas sp. C5510]
MQVSDLLVEVRDRDLRRIAQISPQSLDLSFTVRDSAVGEWRLRLPAEHPAVAHLRVPGAGIVVSGPDGVLLSGPARTPTIEADLADPTGIATVEGVTDESLLWSRLAYPPSDGRTPERGEGAGSVRLGFSDAYAVRTGDAESVMLDFVSANLGAGAEHSRRVPAFEVAASEHRGGPVTKSARFDVLGDLLREIASVASLRFRVVQVGDTLRFEVLDVVDRRATVRFDLVNGTLSAQKVATSPPALTRAIVAGPGEGSDRTIVEAWTAESTEAEDAFGPWGRVERFLDQRGAEDDTELEQAGAQVLGEEGTISVAVRAVASDDLTMRFTTDWGVGDQVAVVVEGQETVSRVTAATVIADASGVTVGATIGDVEGFDPRSALDRRVEDTRARVSSLERTAESGVFSVGDEVVTFQQVQAGTAVQLPTLPYLTRTGVVEQYYTQGAPRVLWDDSTTLSGPYAQLGHDWHPTAGEKVLGIRNTRSGAWVVSPVRETPGLPPRWHPMALENGWTAYSSTYASPAFTRTSLGLVKLRGLIKNAVQSPSAGGVIARLPAGFRPSTLLMFASQISENGGTSGAVDVRPDGSVAARHVAGGWTSLENVVFWAADALPEREWTTATLTNGFQHFVDVSGGGWARVSSYRDPYGVVWERGLATRDAVPGTGVAMLWSPPGQRPAHTQHRRTTANNGHAHVYKLASGATTVGTGAAGSTFVSLDGAPFVDVGSPLTWTPLPLENGWTDYNAQSFSPAAYTRTPDGVVHLRGLVTGGTATATISRLPPGFQSSERLLVGTVANNATARLDVLQTGAIQHLAGSTTWFSLDGLCYVADQ